MIQVKGVTSKDKEVTSKEVTSKKARHVKEVTSKNKTPKTKQNPDECEACVEANCMDELRECESGEFTCENFERCEKFVIDECDEECGGQKHDMDGIEASSCR